MNLIKVSVFWDSVFMVSRFWDSVRLPGTWFYFSRKARATSI